MEVLVGRAVICHYFSHLLTCRCTLYELPVPDLDPNAIEKVFEYYLKNTKYHKQANALPRERTDTVPHFDILVNY